MLILITVADIFINAYIGISVIYSLSSGERNGISLNQPMRSIGNSNIEYRNKFQLLKP